MPEISDISFKKTLINPSMGASVDNPTLTDVSSVVNSLFDAVTTAEALAGKDEYRCIYIHNGHATDSLTSAELFLQQQPTSTTVQLAFGFGSVVTNITMLNNPEISAEDDPPAGITFNVPTTMSPLAVPTIPAGDYAILWLKRIVAPGTAALAADYSRFVVRW